MKFKIQSSELLEALLTVGKVVNPRSTLAILENILFTIEDKTTISLCGSDLDTTMIVALNSVSVENKGKGKVCIPCKRLTDIIKELPVQPLVFSVNPDTSILEITSSKGSCNIPTFDGEDYPLVPVLGENRHRFNAPASTFLEGINRTLFAAATDELRPTVSGLNIDTQEGVVVFNATDSHKLISYKRHDLKVEDQGAFVLPRKPANLLKSILPKEETSITIEWEEKYALFTMGDIKLYSRLVEGKYPKFTSILPLNNTNKLTVDRLELLSSLRLVSQFSPIGTNLLRLELSDNSLVISAQDLDFSLSASERVHCTYDGTPLHIGFKSTFLLEVLSNLVTPDIQIHFNTPEVAALIFPQGEDKTIEETLSLIMPLVLGD